VPATIGQWEQLRELFATSPGVNDCWCMWPRRELMSAERDRARNSADMKTLLESGDSPGLLAVIDERAVGWCATGPRPQYPQYPQRSERGLVWAIPCIYVEPNADRMVVGRALIETVVAIATAKLAVAIDGPPPWWLPGDAAAIALAVRTFVANGFVQIAPGARMPELRRVLAASSPSPIT
jgi:GNAT superfamily N-acetyltransferase